MASSGKKKTTMAKLNRESKLRERRQDKAARKDARKRAAAENPEGIYDEVTGALLTGAELAERALALENGDDPEALDGAAPAPELEAVAQAQPDA